jgi:hypothetical protein
VKEELKRHMKKGDIDIVNASIQSWKGRLCGLVVRVPGYTMEMYCASCEVRTEVIYVM